MLCYCFFSLSYLFSFFWRAALEGPRDGTGELEETMTREAWILHHWWSMTTEKMKWRPPGTCGDGGTLNQQVTSNFGSHRGHLRYCLSLNLHLTARSCQWTLIVIAYLSRPPIYLLSTRTIEKNLDIYLFMEALPDIWLERCQLGKEQLANLDGLVKTFLYLIFTDPSPARA